MHQHGHLKTLSPLLKRTLIHPPYLILIYRYQSSLASIFLVKLGCLSFEAKTLLLGPVTFMSCDSNVLGWIWWRTWMWLLHNITFACNNTDKKNAVLFWNISILPLDCTHPVKGYKSYSFPFLFDVNCEDRNQLFSLY